VRIFKGYHEPVATGPNRSGCVRFESVFIFKSGELQPVRSGPNQFGPVRFRSFFVGSVLSNANQKQFTVNIDACKMQFKRNNTLLFTAQINKNNAAFLDSTTDTISEYANFISTLRVIRRCLRILG
jgi:hypothetical protein